MELFVRPCAASSVLRNAQTVTIPKEADGMDLDTELLLETHHRMVRIREFELAAIDLFKRGQVKGAIHAYIGMEASGVGCAWPLRTDDLIAGTIALRPLMSLTLTIDHRCMNGVQGARFLAEIKTQLEQPHLLLA